MLGYYQVDINADIAADKRALQLMYIEYLVECLGNGSQFNLSLAAGYSRNRIYNFINRPNARLKDDIIIKIGEITEYTISDFYEDIINANGKLKTRKINIKSTADTSSTPKQTKIIVVKDNNIPDETIITLRETIHDYILKDKIDPKLINAFALHDSAVAFCKEHHKIKLTKQEAGFIIDLVLSKFKNF